MDSLGSPICSTSQGGFLEVVYTSGEITGQVSLQARTNHSGASVTANALPPVFTNMSGGFTIAGVPADTYTVVASKSGYLSAQKTGVVVPAGGVVNIGNVMLLGGDANNDGTINIVDLVIVGANYGGAPPADSRADINGDGVANLIDLVLVGSNYGKTGPTDWVSLVMAESPEGPEGFTPRLAFSPMFRILPIDQAVTLDILASGMADLYAGEFEIRYDPTRLEIVDADANAEGIQIGVGEVFAGQDAYVALNSVDAEEGRIRFAATLLTPAPAIQGGAVLAQVTFKGLQQGPTMLRFDEVQLLTSQAAALDVAAKDGWLWLGAIRGMSPYSQFKLERIR